MAEKTISHAISDFYRARRKANLEQLYARLTGRQDEMQLLSYDEVRRKLKASNEIARGLQNIPLNQIVGSVGRYKDFTRSFLPKEKISQGRWAGVVVANDQQGGLPPIELYQIGEAYFVLDGNHRVAISREMGNRTIEAYVKELPVRVPVAADISLDDLIIKEQLIEFLDSTSLDTILPEADLTVTAPGKYQLLREHIEVHQYFMGLDFKRDVPWEEGVEHWYQTIYQPVVSLIRERGMMRDFPDRTETDFYIWLAEHRQFISEEIGWELDTEEAIHALSVDVQTPFLARMNDYIWDMLTPDGLESGPPIGSWRSERIEPRSEMALFQHILVAVEEDEQGWRAVQQAGTVARRENGQVRGLHILDQAQAAPDVIDETLDRVNKGFEDAIWYAQVPGRLAFEEKTEDIARILVKRARWSDLMVVGLTNRPATHLIPRYRSTIRTILRRSPVPVMIVPGEPTAIERPMLAYDGTPKAEEALFTAAYIAGEWHLPLTVLILAKNEVEGQQFTRHVESYLDEQGIAAQFMTETGSVAINLLVTATRINSDLLIMGSYNQHPVVELLWDSPVNEVMRNTAVPILFVR